MNTQTIQADTLYLAYSEMIQKFPSALALDAPDGKLSFAQLDAWSDQITLRLGSEATSQTVCVLFPPGQLYFVALIACMKVGAIAQVLDPATPITESQIEPRAQICLTHSDLCEQAQSLAEQVICCDEIETSSPMDKVDFYTELKATKILHRLMTSGSSGSPTTVSIGRDALVFNAREMSAFYAYRRAVRVANLMRHVTSGCLHAFWRVILSGACYQFFDLHLESFDAIYTRLEQSSAAFVHSGPTILDALASACRDKRRLTAIEHVLIGGGATTHKILQNITNLLPMDCAYTCSYSSTETSQIAAFHSTLAKTLERDRIPCGLPLPSRRVEIQGPDQKPVPRGEIGEIVVTGAFMALEIAGAGTASRLSVHPENPELKIYRTRDLGRWNEEGLLEHCGRVDRQLKINSVRIDPIFIEYELERIAGVTQAFVLAVSNEQDTLELVACLVRDQAVASDETLHLSLAKVLQRAFIPTRYLDIEHLPLLPSGKVNLKALEAWARSSIITDYAPDESSDGQIESPLRQLLRREWEQVLGRSISTNTGSFISVGGNSLAATLLVTELTRLGFVGLDSMWVYQYPTLSAQEQALAKLELTASTSLGLKTDTTGAKREANANPQAEIDRTEILEQLGWV